MQISSWPAHLVGRRVGARLVVAGLFAASSFAFVQVASAQNRPPAPAPAQAARRQTASTRAPKWQVEVHGGVFGEPLGDDLSSGEQFGAFPRGTDFTTSNGLPSRAVPSWAFGDGAVLFDEIRRAFGANYGVTIPGIVSLDGVMQSRGITRKPSAAFGVRFSRDLTSWFAAEIAFDRGPLRSRLSDDATDALEATRASYTAAFQALLGTIPQNGGRVTSTVTTPADASDNQTILTGSAVLSFVRTSRVRVHAVVGGGLIMNDGSGFEAKLQSNYQFSIFSTFPINESESVTLRFSEKKQVPTGVFGLGATIRAAGNTGVRVEARLLASQTSAETRIDASASAIRASQFVSFPSITNPSLQFSTLQNARTTLSGDPINGLVTYSGKRLDLRPHLTIGYFVRF